MKSKNQRWPTLTRQRKKTTTRQLQEANWVLKPDNKHLKVWSSKELRHCNSSCNKQRPKCWRILKKILRKTWMNNYKDICLNKISSLLILTSNNNYSEILPKCRKIKNVYMIKSNSSMIRLVSWFRIKAIKKRLNTFKQRLHWIRSFRFSMKSSIKSMQTSNRNYPRWKWSHKTPRLGYQLSKIRWNSTRFE